MSRRSPASSLGTRAVLVCALAAASCTGSINGDPSGSPSAGGGGSQNGGSGTNRGGMGGVDHPPPPPASLCQNVDPGPSPMRLLTRVEYTNTVRDLFGPMIAGTSVDLPDDGRPVRAYANDTTGRSASDLLVDKFSKA